MCVEILKPMLASERRCHQSKSIALADVATGYSNSELPKLSSTKHAHRIAKFTPIGIRNKILS